MGQLSRFVDVNVVTFTTADGACCVDAQGAEGVMFIAIAGTTANRISSMALSYGASTGSLVSCASTFTNASTAAGHYPIITDVYKPTARYICATVTSSTGLPHTVLGVKYGLREQPTTGFSSTDLPVAIGGVLRCISPTSSTA